MPTNVQDDVAEDSVAPMARAVVVPSSAAPVGRTAFPTKAQMDEYEAFLQHYNEFIDRQMKEGTDYGLIPGVEKPSLFKPGAEKLEKLFFLTHQKDVVEKIVEPDFIKYTYRTTVYDQHGRKKATCEGTCNSKEKKYRWITVFADRATEKEKAAGKLETRKSKQGRDYSVYVIEREDYYDLENTIMKMSQKRSYVGAILEATNSSGRFTQDVEDIAPNDAPLDVAKVVAAGGSVCPKCGKGQLVEKLGKFGPFRGCERYPACRFIEKKSA